MSRSGLGFGNGMEEKLKYVCIRIVLEGKCGLACTEGL